MSRETTGKNKKRRSLLASTHTAATTTAAVSKEKSLGVAQHFHLFAYYVVPEKAAVETAEGQVLGAWRMQLCHMHKVQSAPGIMYCPLGNANFGGTIG